MSTVSLGARLRAIINERRAVIIPGIANALAARIVQDLGFEALYISGAGVSNTFYGVPDMGFVGLSEIVQHAAAIRNAVDLPIIVDADTGFGNAVNVLHTVRMLERAGVNAIQLEDQVMPKRCGHFAGKDVIPTKDMMAKIKAATDARQSEDLLIIARTDVLAQDGFQAAVDRAQGFIEAGADLTFVEAVETVEDLRKIPALLSAPQVLNVVVGGKTPVVKQSELQAMEYGLVLYANSVLQGSIIGMQAILKDLLAHGQVDEDNPKVAPFAERQRLVQKPLFDAYEAKYKVG